MGQPLEMCIRDRTEETKSDKNDKEAIGTLSKADQADIYSIIENSASLTYSLQVQPTRLLELNNDHSAVEGYSQDMFIDYYNTYTPETYNLQAVSYTHLDVYKRQHLG